MTDPTADAAKLLPCPFMQDGHNHILRVTAVITSEFRVRCACGAQGPIGSTEAEASERWNTRPQPAPPAGEPDFALIASKLAHDAEATELASYVEGDKLAEQIEIELQKAYRLGAASRPKVEDADLLNAVTDLIDEDVFGDAANRDKAERIISLVLTANIPSPDREFIRHIIGDLRYHGAALCAKAADLLERLAGDFGQLQAAFELANEDLKTADANLEKLLEADVQRVKDISRLTIERDEAREILAEREAELATAAEITDKIAANPPVTPNGRHSDWQHGWQDGGMEVAAALREANAARQQQKEPK